MEETQKQEKKSQKKIDWTPKIKKFSREELGKVWPRVLSVESALVFSGAHKS